MEENLVNAEQHKLLLQLRGYHNTIVKARERTNDRTTPILTGLFVGICSFMTAFMLMDPEAVCTIITIPGVLGFAAAFLLYKLNGRRLTRQLSDAEEALRSAVEDISVTHPEWISEIGGKEVLLDQRKVEILIFILSEATSKAAEKNEAGEVTSAINLEQQIKKLENTLLPNENICDGCDERTFSGKKTVVYTAEIIKAQWYGNSQHIEYGKFHRINVFLCSECKRDNVPFKEAVIAKDTKFGRVGSSVYWLEREALDIIIRLWNSYHKTSNYVLIKDLMKDELEDKSPNRNVTLRLCSARIPGYAPMVKTLYLDDLLVALWSTRSESDITIHTTPGEHKLALGGRKAVTAFRAKENEVYEFELLKNGELVKH